MYGKFCCERCDKDKPLIERGKKNVGRPGICINCLKKMGIYKDIRAAGIPKRNKTRKKKKNPMVHGYLTPEEDL